MKIITTIILFIIISLSSASANTYLDQVRLERIEACNIASQEYAEWIKDRYIHRQQDPVLRCATFMHLVYAYESWWWTSPRCQNDMNCFWIKQPTYNPFRWISYWVRYPGRFIIFENKQDANLVFARLYFRWHMNKTIPVFINWWSMTDRDTYIAFMQDRFVNTYHIYESLTVEDYLYYYLNKSNGK